MRITIEIDEKQQPAAVVTATGAQAILTGEPEVPATSAGGAPEALLETLGITPPEGLSSQPSTQISPEADVDLMSAGTPPDWLIRTIESANPMRSGM